MPRRLADVVLAKAGNNKIIKGEQSDRPEVGLFQGFSASGPDIWVATAEYEQPGVVLSAVGARCGKTFLAEGAWTAIANTHVLLPSKCIDHRWLWYLTNDESFWVRGGSAQPFVKVRESLQREVRIPSLPEQRRIVAILDEAFESIATAKAHAEKNLRNARDVFDVHLQRTFSELDASCPRKTFETLAVSTLIGLTRSSREQGVALRCRYVKMNNITPDNRFDPHSLVTVDASDAEVDRYSLESGDFLFNTRNSHELVGKSCVFDGGEDEVLFNNNIMRVRFLPEVNSRFILNAFSYAGTRLQLEAMKSGTTNVAAIYYRDLAKLSLPVPDYVTQEAVVTSLAGLSSHCHQLSEVQKRKLAALDELKQSLLHQAFSGQL